MIRVLGYLNVREKRVVNWPFDTECPLIAQFLAHYAAEERGATFNVQHVANTRSSASLIRRGSEYIRRPLLPSIAIEILLERTATPHNNCPARTLLVHLIRHEADTIDELPRGRVASTVDLKKGQAWPPGAGSCPSKALAELITAARLDAVHHLDVVVLKQCEVFLRLFGSKFDAAFQIQNVLV